MALAADTAPAPKAKQTVADTPFVIVAPSEEIVVTFPLFVVERGVVENVYADIFTWESKKGIGDLKKGDKVRARVFPGDDGQPASAISLDVYKF